LVVIPREPLDLQIRFAAHVAASLKRDECARKGLEYQKAGKIEAARAALRQAERWDFKRRLLEL
jgi:hypothetical protein